MRRPIYPGLSPNLETDDVLLAAQTLIRGPGQVGRKDVEGWWEDFLGKQYSAVAFNSGRSAEWAILKALGVGQGDEVLLQAFTCVAVPNSVLWLGATPVYVDIQARGFNMDTADLERKVTSRSRVVIVQHTFGRPADLATIGQICDRYHLALVEDCAHALGATYRGQKVGTWGRAAFFSLGMDKVVSSVFGGMATTADSRLAQRLRDIETRLPENNIWWTRQQLLHPVITGGLMPGYDAGVGKAGLWLAAKTGLLAKAVYSQEKRGIRPPVFPAKYPNELAALGWHQLHKLDRFNRHRRAIAAIYTEGAVEKGNIYLKYGVVTAKADMVFKKAKERGWILGDLYSQVVAPAADPRQVGYIAGSCPRAEAVAGKVVNLPTHIGLRPYQAQQIWREVRRWLE